MNRPLRGRLAIFICGGDLEKVMSHFHENGPKGHGKIPHFVGRRPFSSAIVNLKRSGRITVNSFLGGTHDKIKSKRLFDEGFGCCRGHSGFHGSGR